MAQSYIKAGRAQLFVETATDFRLDVLAENLGLSRAGQAVSDDEWRSLVRRISFNPKLVTPIFYRALEICIGPQFSRATNFKETAEVGDTKIVVNDATQIVVPGETILSYGTSSQETVFVTRKDESTNTLYLKEPLQNNHTTLLPDYFVYQTTDTNVGAASIPVFDDELLYQTTYPFPLPVLIGQNTDNEELKTISAYASNALTLSSTSSKSHKGLEVSFYKTELAAAALDNQFYLRLTPGDVVNLPTEGFLRIGGLSPEVVQYTGIDTDSSIVYLKFPLTVNHALGDDVVLLKNSGLVRYASVFQQGMYWSVYNTSSKKVQIYIPKSSLDTITYRDASFLHGTVPSPVSTTLSSGASPTSTSLTLTSVAGLPATGMLQINSAQIVFYTLLDTATNKVFLTRELGNTYLAGVTVDLYRVPYVGSSLEDGNPFNAGTPWLYHFPGPYIYDNSLQGFSGVQSTLTAVVPPSINVVYTQVPNTCNLEVSDASLWPAPAFTPFKVRIGALTSNQEDLLINNRVLKNGTTTTVASPASIGDSSITFTSSTAFPISSGAYPAGYRVIVDKGGANEEILIVNQNNTGTGVVSFVSPLTKNHIATESIQLLNDVLTFSTAFSFTHLGPITTPINKKGELVQPFLSQISVASSSSFSTSGKVWLNFGKNILNDSQRITSLVSPTVYELTSTANFPTTNYPYQVILGPGTLNEEVINVSNNNTGTNRLTFSTTPANPHLVNDYVSYSSGDPEVVEYASKNGNNLVFTTPVVLLYKHLIGEVVTQANQVSRSLINGDSYGFKLPPDPLGCLNPVLEVMSAAGVQVIFIDTK